MKAIERYKGIKGHVSVESITDDSKIVYGNCFSEYDTENTTFIQGSFKFWNCSDHGQYGRFVTVQSTVESTIIHINEIEVYGIVNSDENFERIRFVKSTVEKMDDSMTVVPQYQQYPIKIIDDLFIPYFDVKPIVSYTRVKDIYGSRLTVYFDELYLVKQIGVQPLYDMTNGNCIKIIQLLILFNNFT